MKRLGFFGAVAAAFGLALASAGVAGAADQIYWGSFTALRVAPLAGGSGSTLISDSGFPIGSVLDVAAGKVYYADQNSAKIRVADLNGNNAQDLYTFASPTNTPIGTMGIDTTAGKVYWADWSAGVIRVGNTDGSGSQALFSGESGPIGVSVDTAAGKIYWADWKNGTIRVGNLNGTGTPQTLFSGEANPYGVAIDVAGGRIYWADQGAGTIREGNIDGTGTAQTLFSGESGPSGLALDPYSGKLYWANVSSGSIRVGSSAGGTGQNLFTGESSPVSPTLLRAPGAAGAPVISGASTVGSTLSCSKGSWDPDLQGAHVFRIPQSYAYSWEENGAPISGSSSTITARSAGSYTCTVTATNSAGSASETSAAYMVAAAPPNGPPTTTITGAKIKSAEGTATFTFKATPGATGFRCALVRKGQKAHFKACTSGRTYKNLKPGSYTFEVRAVSAAGTGPIARKRFKIAKAKPKPSTGEPPGDDATPGNDSAGTASDPAD